MLLLPTHNFTIYHICKLNKRGTGINCTEPKLQVDKFAREHKTTRRLFCTEGQISTSYNLALRVNFVRLSVLHGGSTLYGDNFAQNNTNLK